jgi:hypothetical protein
VTCESFREDGYFKTADTLTVVDGYAKILGIISQTLQHHRQLRLIHSATRGSAFVFEFVEQVSLCLDEQTMKQALCLFKETNDLNYVRLPVSPINW